MVACDPTLHAALGLIQASAAFQNPIAGMVGGIKTAGFAQDLAITSAIAALDPTDPNYAANLLLMNNLQTGLRAFTGHDSGSFAASPMGMIQSHSDFMSGAVPGFPSGALSSIVGSIPGSAVLATTSFSSVMAMAKASPAIQQNNCSFDPASPCAGINAIFGTVGGAFNSTLQQMQGMLQGMTDFLANGAAYINQLAQFANSAVAQITNELTSLVNTIVQAAQVGLTKILMSLGLDPCMGPIIKNIGTPALLTALQI